MTTPNNQDDELDKILHQLYQYKSSLANSINRRQIPTIKAAILNWHNKQLEQAVIEAETRGRTSETEYWRKSGFLPLFDADKRLADLSKLQEEQTNE